MLKKRATKKKKKKKMKTISKGPVLHRLIRDMSNGAYHGSAGTWSSSQFKDIIDDEDLFIKKHIKKQGEKISSEAMDTGTYLHTGILEPHKLASEVAVFEGKTRYGKAWEIFKKKNEGKMIINTKQKELGDGMIRAVKASPTSMEYLEGEPEVSLFNKLLVSGGEIYAPFYGKILTLNGWEKAGKIPTKGFEMVVKTRADCLGETFISDLKSTSGKATQAASVRGSISKYKYDLSAALYLDMFSLARPDVSTFIWIFASKENPMAAAWRATEENIRIGRAKWSWAVKRLADMSAAKFETVDYLRDAEPLHHEKEWLEQKLTDLL